MTKNVAHFSSVREAADESSKQETLLDIVKDWSLFLRLANLAFSWLVINLGYYGLTLTSTSLSGDPYLNFFLVSLVEIPGKLSLP